MQSKRKVWLWLTATGSALAAVTGLAWWVLSSTMLAPSAAVAQAGNRVQVVPIPDPLVLRPEWSFNDGVMRGANTKGSVQWESQTRRDPAGQWAEVTLTLRNDAPVVANLNLYLYQGWLNAVPGKRHMVQATVTQAASTDVGALLGIGFHLHGEDGRYLGQQVDDKGRAAWGVPGEQHVRTVLRLQADSTINGQRVGHLMPRVSLFNLEPGVELRATVRWRPVVIEEDTAGAGLIEHNEGVVTVGQSRMLFASVAGVGLSRHLSDKPLDQVLILRSPNGQEWRSVKPGLPWQQPVRHTEAWEWALPDNVPEGRFSLWFGLRERDEETWLPLRSSRESIPVDAGPVPVGEVQLTREQVPMLVGMSFHRYPGRSTYMMGPIKVGYDFTRSLAADGMHIMQWWQAEDQYTWGKVDAWADFHARDGRGVIVVFTGSPTWASQRPEEDSVMKVPGNAAPPDRRWWPAYERMVAATVTRLKGKLTAVECWNEPDLKGSFSGTATELADLCKIVAVQTRQVAPEVPVICPQASDAKGMPFALGAKTSAGEPITEFCDYVGAHIYGALGVDPQGKAYEALGVRDQLQAMHAYLRAMGINKPLAVTEYGVAACTGSPLHGYPLFSRMPSPVAGEALYQSIRAFREAGVRILGLYSYDHEDRDPKCRPGGSFIRSTKTDVFGGMSPDMEVLSRINEARQRFGQR